MHHEKVVHIWSRATAFEFIGIEKECARGTGYKVQLPRFDKNAFLAFKMFFSNDLLCTEKVDSVYGIE